MAETTRIIYRVIAINMLDFCTSFVLLLCLNFELKSIYFKSLYICLSCKTYVILFIKHFTLTNIYNAVQKMLKYLVLH